MLDFLFDLMNAVKQGGMNASGGMPGGASIDDLMGAAAAPQRKSYPSDMVGKTMTDVEGLPWKDQQQGGGQQMDPQMMDPREKALASMDSLAKGDYDNAGNMRDFYDIFNKKAKGGLDFDRNELKKAMLLSGLKMLAVAGTPGNTLGQAVGEGVGAGVGDLYKTRDEDAKRSAEAMKEVYKVASGIDDNRTKKGYNEALMNYRMTTAAKPSYATETGADGNMYRINKDTGEASPVVGPDGGAFAPKAKGGSDDAFDKMVQQQLSGGGASATSMTQAPAPAPSNVVPQQAIMYLKQHPETAPMFEQKYGVQANKYLTR